MFFLISEKYNEKDFRVYRDAVLGVVKNKCFGNRKVGNCLLKGRYLIKQKN